MERIGTYAVVRKLGEGGMGTVWLARSRGGRLVAVKVARPELAGDAVFRERFRAEVAAARTVGGFHTAPVVDADPEAEEPWLATAYVPGPTLQQLVADEGPMDPERLRGLGAALAEALQAIHRCGLVHRDLKPGNIVMAEDGPRVLDFGISRAVENTRLTATGTAFGTPGFLAPEQAEGLDVGPAADVFALGAVLVAAAGGSAFGGGTPVAMMYRSVHHEPDLTAVPGELRPIAAACLEKSPERRPSTERLLDLFDPEDAPAPVPVDRGVTSYQLAPPSTPSTPAPPRTAPASPPTPPPMPAYAPLAAPQPSPYAPTAGFTPEQPEFLAMDRRNAVVLDVDGISLGTNGEVVEVPWAAVDVAWCERAAGRGFRLVVAVARPDGTLHSCEVSTRQAAELDAWTVQFTAALTYYRPEAHAEE